MESITKTSLSASQLSDIIKHAFNDTAKVADIREINDGFYNSVYSLTLSDCRKVILKAAPSKNVKVLRYEKGIMETEVQVLIKLQGLSSIPVPKVLFYDRSCTLVETEYFIMEHIEGVALSKVHSELSPECYSKITSDIGMYAAQLKAVTGSCFGSITQSDRQYTTWGEAFLSMISDLMEDAKDMKVILPRGYEDIKALVNARLDILNSVKTSSLIHKDLWEGNIFIDSNTNEVTGFIDFERAVYGDPLLEPVCGFLLHSPDFMLRYLGKTELSFEETVRTILYRIYLFLIMVIECPFRKYPGENPDAWQREQLEIALKELEMIS